MPPLRQHFRRTVDGIVAELRLVSLRGDRGQLCAETVASVVLAVYVADIFSLKERWWVALSAYAVLRADPITVFRRCLERLVGTVIGAFSSLLLAALIFPSAWLTLVTLALVAGVGIYCMLGSAYAYSWVLGTVTALMVLGDAGSAALPIDLAVNRVLDVAVGILATATVSAASFSIERLLCGGGSSAHPSSPAARGAHELFAPPIVAHSRSLRMWQALQGAVAIALIGLVNHLHALPDFAQSMVSVVAVLLLPLSAMSDGHGTSAVHVRMFNRLLGCFFAALLAAPLLPLIGETPFLCLAVLGVGVWLAAHIQSGSTGVSYIGTQFGVGFIMIFVQDHAWSTDAFAALERLMGIVGALIGLAATMAALGILRAGFAKTRRAQLRHPKQPTQIDLGDASIAPSPTTSSQNSELDRPS